MWTIILLGLLVVLLAFIVTVRWFKGAGGDEPHGIPRNLPTKRRRR